MVLARPDEREECPYHFSLRLYTMVRRSSCGPIVCWILAQTSSLVKGSLKVVRSILRQHLISLARIFLCSSEGVSGCNELRTRKAVVSSLAPDGGGLSDYYS